MINSQTHKHKWTKVYVIRRGTRSYPDNSFTCGHCFPSRRRRSTTARRSLFSGSCVSGLKNNTDQNLQLIGRFIEDQIESAKTIYDQFTIVFSWLNLFGYHPDDLTLKKRVRSNFSDANHATNAIACDKANKDSALIWKST